MLSSNTLINGLTILFSIILIRIRELRVSSQFLESARSDFASFASSKLQIIKAMKDVYRQDRYLVCPHTATAVIAVNALKLPADSTVILVRCINIFTCTNTYSAIHMAKLHIQSYVHIFALNRTCIHLYVCTKINIYIQTHIHYVHA